MILELVEINRLVQFKGHLRNIVHAEALVHMGIDTRIIGLDLMVQRFNLGQNLVHAVLYHIFVAKDQSPGIHPSYGSCKLLVNSGQIANLYQHIAPAYIDLIF